MVELCEIYLDGCPIPLSNGMLLRISRRRMGFRGAMLLMGGGLSLDVGNAGNDDEQEDRQPIMPPCHERRTTDQKSQSKWRTIAQIVLGIYVRDGIH